MRPDIDQQHRIRLVKGLNVASVLLGHGSQTSLTSFGRMSQQGTAACKIVHIAGLGVVRWVIIDALPLVDP